MTLSPTAILPFDYSNPELVDQSEALLDRAFGIGRRTKTSYRFREGEQPVEGLSYAVFKTEDGGAANVRNLCAVLSYWHLRIGEAGHKAIMLGPLAVEPHLQGKGFGRDLMKYTLPKARELGHKLVFLVGDEPYYAPFGFSRVPDGRLLLPGYVDPARLLFCELVACAFDGMDGLVLPPSRYEAGRNQAQALA
jgi:predicted N-acetyltransferase YhbS